MEKILVPTDFSDLSYTALEYASIIADTYDAEVFLIHVLEHLPVEKKKKNEQGKTIREYKKEARDKLKELSMKFLPLVENVEFVVLQGNPYKEILKYVVDNEIGLIVLATHGKTGFKHVLIGSIAEKIVRHAPVPVLTVKPTEVRDKFLTSDDVEKELHLKYKRDEFLEL
ncbi:MAG: universal stress protein [Bacteroidetes bacterium]|nr:universal stress protein [Bacteroidota bacterium]